MYVLVNRQNNVHEKNAEYDQKYNATETEHDVSDADSEHSLQASFNHVTIVEVSFSYTFLILARWQLFLQSSDL